MKKNKNYGVDISCWYNNIYTEEWLEIYGFECKNLTWDEAMNLYQQFDIQEVKINSDGRTIDANGNALSLMTINGVFLEITLFESFGENEDDKDLMRKFKMIELKDCIDKIHFAKFMFGTYFFPNEMKIISNINSKIKA